jgi:hypothetical protein
MDLMIGGGVPRKARILPRQKLKTRRRRDNDKATRPGTESRMTKGARTAPSADPFSRRGCQTPREEGGVGAISVLTRPWLSILYDGNTPSVELLDTCSSLVEI